MDYKDNQNKPAKHGYFCGACQSQFNDSESLRKHLKSCFAAKNLLFPFTALMLGAKDYGHKAGHLLCSIPKATDYIDDYAKSVAFDYPSWERLQIHMRLCQKLGIEYATFRPFECDSISEVPTVEKAKQIIYESLSDLAFSNLKIETIKEQP